MQPLPANIIRFFQTNHVVSIAASAGGEIWSASCFYVFDEGAGRLIVLTAHQTRHGSLMAVNPQISGTVAGQPSSVAEICGIQFSATARLMEDGTGRRAALARYYRTHPVARAMKSDVWSLDLNTVKFTDNQSVFAHKTLWQRKD